MVHLLEDGAPLGARSAMLRGTREYPTKPRGPPAINSRRHSPITLEFDCARQIEPAVFRGSLMIPPQDDPDAGKLLAAADRALERAREQGRNCVVALPRREA